MENLVLSFNVVLPLSICIALGYFLRCARLLDEHTRKSVNRLCFKVFLPVYLFGSIYNTDMSEAFNARLIVFVVAGILGLFAALMLLIPRIEKENPKRGVMIQGIFRSNFALFGVPVAISICGEQNIGPTALLVSFVVPVYNVLAVIALESFRGGRPSVKKIAWGIAKNPLIIGSVLGIAMNLLDIGIPSAVMKSITDLGRITTPLALVVLGGEFTLKKINGYAKQLLITVSGRLVLVPFVMVALGIAFGFRDETLTPILAVFGSPAAVSSFAMAEQMGGDGPLAASIVVLTTGLSIVTMFLFIFGLKQLGCI